MTRSYNTLFLIQSIDGKINFSATDELDIDKHSKFLPGYHEGRFQYKELEQQTDLVSMNTGRVMAKIGVNIKHDPPSKMEVDFVIVDNKPHLSVSGVRYLLRWVKQLYLVTINPDHPAMAIKDDNLIILQFDGTINFTKLFVRLYEEFNIDRITVQSGGHLNATLIRKGLIDELSLVIAPLVIGGQDTPTLMDGHSLKTIEDLQLVAQLELLDIHQLDHSYVHIQYRVINRQK